ncbi:uncharacterized protein LOC128956955 [Oppia nitens]|uniref:uncharacterized protein LOC128956955 n=1 Tax=Oppia nitens TaxID=1686743 RepID=UPI0023DC1F55|nr:uncharacterized protein LOC128956955 [Oppia nitens]
MDSYSITKPVGGVAVVDIPSNSSSGGGSSPTTTAAVINYSPSAAVAAMASTPPEPNIIIDMTDQWYTASAATGATGLKVQRRTFWRNTIGTVLVPFVFFGAPVLSTVYDTGSRFPVNTTALWLRYLFKMHPLLPLNIILLLGTVALNSWILYKIFDVLIRLLFIGELHIYYIDVVIDMIDWLPIVVAIDMFWLKGYVVRQVVIKLDTVVITHFSQSVPPATVIMKVSVLVLLVIVCHCISFSTLQWKIDKGVTWLTTQSYLYDLAHGCVSWFLMPVYIVFTMGIQLKYRQINDYLNHLTRISERPEQFHMKQIKFLFKTSATLIKRMNYTFNQLMSLFFSLLMLEMTIDFGYTMFTLYLFVYKLNKIEDPGAQLEFSKGLVRVLSADLLVQGIRLGLIAVTGLSMVRVNYESRSVPVHFYDWMSQFTHTVSPQIYQSFRLLRYYMISKIENIDSPALLVITFLKNTPFIGQKITPRNHNYY